MKAPPLRSAAYGQPIPCRALRSNALRAVCAGTAEGGDQGRGRRIDDFLDDLDGSNDEERPPRGADEDDK